MYLPYLSQLALPLILAITPVLALPAAEPSPYQPLASYAGENGFYSVITARDGSHSAVFTPFEAIDNAAEKRALEERISSPVPESSLEKRTDWNVVCNPWQNLNANDLLQAQSTLRAAASREGSWGVNHWAFVRYNSVIAYGCAYQQVGVSANIVNTFELQLDDTCHWPIGGYTSARVSAGQVGYGLAVGRGPYGTEICASGFIGW